MPEAAARLDGTAALVTGAAGGIGLAVARRLAHEGARVMLTDRDADRLETATATLRDEGADAAFLPADLAVAAERDRLVPAVIGRWGRIDILVNNAAAHGARTPFVESSEDDWNTVFATNADAAAALCRAAAGDMLPRRVGAIVNISSIQAEMPVATYAPYVATKGALLALTRALAVELSPHGIRANAVAPGVIATEQFTGTLEAKRDGRAGAAPGANAALLPRQGRPEEVAGAVAFLASADAAFITGATLRVDGGRSISRRADPFEAAFGDPGSDEVS